MQDQAEHLARRRAAISPPGRMRVFAAGPIPGEAQPEWSGASDADLLAAAWGASLAEHPRGGEVLAVLSGPRPSGPPSGDQSSPGLTVCAGQPLTPSAPRRREWQPVHLASLRTWRTACAGASGGCEAWLERLAAIEPAVLRVDHHAVLGALPASPAVAIAAAQLASEGRRVVWRVPTGTDLLGWLPALRAIGARALPLKLVVDLDDVPAWCHWRDLPGWWVAAPADRGEMLATLGWALDGEDTVVVAIPTSIDGIPPWPQGADHEPGSARWLSQPAQAAATVACDARSLAAALGAQAILAAAGRTIALLHCTSVVPLPVAVLAAAAARGPLIVVDAADAATGIGGAVTLAFVEDATRAPVLVDRGADAGEVARAVMSAIGG